MKTIRNKTVNQTIRKYLLDNMDFSGYVGYFDGMDTEPKTDTEKTLAIYKKTSRFYKLAARAGLCYDGRLHLLRSNALNVCMV